jgi:hypothetical protein
VIFLHWRRRVCASAPVDNPNTAAMITNPKVLLIRLSILRLNNMVPRETSCIASLSSLIKVNLNADEGHFGFMAARRVATRENGGWLHPTPVIQPLRAASWAWRFILAGATGPIAAAPTTQRATMMHVQSEIVRTKGVASSIRLVESSSGPPLQQCPCFGNCHRDIRRLSTISSAQFRKYLGERRRLEASAPRSD